MEITVLPRAILAQAIQSQLTISFLVSVNLDAEKVLPEYLNFPIMERSVLLYRLEGGKLSQLDGNLI